MNAPLVVASAGTYHLPFERLSEWVQRWLASRTGVRVIMQHGPSRSVVGAENHSILPYDELLEICSRADVVVLQGGAGGVMDMRARAIVPIVVPRVPSDGEVVDDHQLVFTAEMEKLGLIRRATTYDQFASMLDEALAGSVAASDEVDVATPGADAVRRIVSEPIARLPLRTVFARFWRSVGAIFRSRLRIKPSGR